MRGAWCVVRILPDLRVTNLAAAGALYADFLRMAREELGLDWVDRYLAPSGAAVQAERC